MNIEAGSNNIKIKLEPLKGKFRWMLISKVIFLLVNILLVLYFVHMSQIAERIDQGEVNAAYEFEVAFGWVIVIGFLIFVSFVLMLVMTSLWVYRAGLNLHLLEMPDLKFTPGWYAGWFFVPVAMWFMPLFTMSEIGKASASINNKENWKNAPVPRMVIVWYILFLAFWIYFFVSWYTQEETPRTADPLLGFAKKVPDQIIPALVSIFAYVVLFLPSILFAGKVTKQQHAYINS